MDEKYREFYNTIGAKIAFFRKQKGLTQERLAEKIDKSWSAVAKIESAKTEKGISLKTLFDISAALNIPISKFFD